MTTYLPFWHQIHCFNTDYGWLVQTTVDNKTDLST